MLKRIMTVFAVVFAFLFAGTAAQAASTTHYSLSGRTADASFEDIQGCTSTNAYVNATDGRVKFDDRPAAQSYASIYISQYDTCTGTMLAGYSCKVQLNPDDFQASWPLDTATLHVNDAPCYDWVTGETTTADVAVSWTCTSDIYSYNGRSHYQAPGLIVNSRYAGQFCAAAASGTFRVNNMSLTANAMYAEISKVRSGDVTISY